VVASWYNQELVFTKFKSDLIIRPLTRKIPCSSKRGLRLAIQIMADLPTDRVEPSPTFTNAGVDAFGPWTIVSRRTRGGYANSKRWAIMFTCLVTTIVHGPKASTPTLVKGGDGSTRSVGRSAIICCSVFPLSLRQVIHL
jgi:hypothetical protein